MINLAPWYYRDLLGTNEIIENPEFFEIDLLNHQHKYEAVVSLREALKPSWIVQSKIYRNCDGTGTDQHKNMAVYKAISEALERWAFYELVDSNKFGFKDDPTTTGMAAFPHFLAKRARDKAREEAVERWAIHEFNRHLIPIKEHFSEIKDLIHYELMNPIKDVSVSLVFYKSPSFYAYGFAGGKSLTQSFGKALIELDRNIRVLNQAYLKSNLSLDATTDKTLFFYSTEEGFRSFQEKIDRAPKSIANLSPRVICDQELKGPWSKYSKVWRFLLEDSYFDYSQDSTFFMF